jgi:hypothetical protein
MSRGRGDSRGRVCPSRRLAGAPVGRAKPIHRRRLRKDATQLQKTPRDCQDHQHQVIRKCLTEIALPQRLKTGGCTQRQCCRKPCRARGAPKKSYPPMGTVGAHRGRGETTHRPKTPDLKQEREVKDLTGGGHHQWDGGVLGN